MHAPQMLLVLRVALAGTLGVALLALASSASDGASARRLDKARKLAVAASGSLQNPCWSPTGDRLAITRWLARYNAGNAVVAIVAAQGGPARTVSPTESQSVNLPGSCWDRATDAIAYTADPDGADQVYLVAADGSALARRVTSDPVVAFEPSLSPDGAQVVFENHQNGERGEIAIADVATGAVRRITSGADDRQPNWSPRGDLIVFQRTRGRGLPDLYVVRPDGGGLRNVTKSRRLEETDVSFSPSGTWLVFSCDGDEIDVASLFTISINGKGRRQLTRTRGIYDGAPSWSVTGTIAFESARGDPDRSKGTAIWTIPAPRDRR